MLNAGIRVCLLAVALLASACASFEDVPARNAATHVFDPAKGAVVAGFRSEGNYATISFRSIDQARIGPPTGFVARCFSISAPIEPSCMIMAEVAPGRYYLDSIRIARTAGRQTTIYETTIGTLENRQRRPDSELIVFEVKAGERLYIGDLDIDFIQSARFGGPFLANVRRYGANPEVASRFIATYPGFGSNFVFRPLTRGVGTGTAAPATQ